MSSALLARRYELRSRLADGGMGSVHLAHDTVLDRPVVVKLPHRKPQFESPKYRERFRQEARAAARLQHENVVRIYDSGEDEGQLFLVMEFVEGETLASLMDRQDLPYAKRFELLAQLCDAVDAVHRAGIVHRDIKPLNLMVSEDTRRLKLLDFGVAKVSGPSQASIFAGSPQYMSPEQLVLGEIDSRSDIFAIGLVAYELLTYRPVVPPGSSLEDLIRLLEKPSSMTELPVSVRGSVEAIVFRCLAKRAADRFGSAREVGEKLKAIERETIAAATTVFFTERSARERETISAVTEAPPVIPPVRPRLSRRLFALGAGVAAIITAAALAYRAGGSGSPPPSSQLAVTTSTTVPATTPSAATPAPPAATTVPRATTTEPATNPAGAAASAGTVVIGVDLEADVSVDSQSHGTVYPNDTSSGRARGGLTVVVKPGSYAIVGQTRGQPVVKDVQTVVVGPGQTKAVQIALKNAFARARFDAAARGDTRYGTLEEAYELLKRAGAVSPQDDARVRQSSTAAPPPPPQPAPIAVPTGPPAWARGSFGGRLPGHDAIDVTLRFESDQPSLGVFRRNDRGSDADVSEFRCAWRPDFTGLRCGELAVTATFNANVLQLGAAPDMVERVLVGNTRSVTPSRELTTIAMSAVPSWLFGVFEAAGVPWASENGDWHSRYRLSSSFRAATLFVGTGPTRVDPKALKGVKNVAVYIDAMREESLGRCEWTNQFRQLRCQRKRATEQFDVVPESTGIALVVRQRGDDGPAAGTRLLLTRKVTEKPR